MRTLFLIITIIVAIPLYSKDDEGNVLRRQFIENIVQNPQEIVAIVDTSLKAFGYYKSNELTDSALLYYGNLLNSKFAIDGEIRFSLFKSEEYEVFSDYASYLGIIRYHEVTIQNPAHDRFLNFVFMQLAGKWMLAFIHEGKNLRIPYGH